MRHALIRTGQRKLSLSRAERESDEAVIVGASYIRISGKFASAESADSFKRQTGGTILCRSIKIMQKIAKE